MSYPLSSCCTTHRSLAAASSGLCQGLKCFKGFKGRQSLAFARWSQPLKAICRSHLPRQLGSLLWQAVALLEALVAHDWHLPKLEAFQAVCPGLQLSHVMGLESDRSQQLSLQPSLTGNCIFHGGTAENLPDSNLLSSTLPQHPNLNSACTERPQSLSLTGSCSMQNIKCSGQHPRWSATAMPRRNWFWLLSLRLWFDIT